MLIDSRGEEIHSQRPLASSLREDSPAPHSFDFAFHSSASFTSSFYVLHIDEVMFEKDAQSLYLSRNKLGQVAEASFNQCQGDL